MPLQTPPVPSATDDPNEHADWLELAAILSPTSSVSIQDLTGSIGISGSVDALPEMEEVAEGTMELDEICEPLAEAAFGELDERLAACGGDVGTYPFTLTDNALSLKPDWKNSIYTFLALLAYYGAAARIGDSATKLFEEVSASALSNYLGSESPLIKTVVFGFPRSYKQKDFAGALNELCKQFGEGLGHSGAHEIPTQKDAKLDIVGWKEFQDLQPGKIIVFGQCATGNWTQKITELPEPNKWCGYWMQQVPSVLPIRSFFVPHRISRKRWRYVCTFGGILFDRCRMACLIRGGHPDLEKRCSDWTKDLLGQGS